MSESTHIPGRRCTACLEVKPLTAFSMRSRNGKPSRPRSTCRECNADYIREYGRERREFIRNYKAERGCADCGYNKDARALEFDHLPGMVKLFDVSAMRFRGSWQQLHEEIAKCEVVCANCHRIRTDERNDSGRNREWDLRVDASPINEYLRSLTDVDQLELPLD